jgi:hypothetical protein
MWEDRVGLRGVPHVFLNAEIVHAQIKVQRRSHTHRAQVCSAVRAGADMVDFREAGNFFRCVIPPAWTTVVRM